MRLSPSTLDALRAVGLEVDGEPLFPPDHVAWPDGYVVLKPTSAGGNGVPGWRSVFRTREGRDETTDAPSVRVWAVDGGWGMEVAEWCPGPGPGDFVRRLPDEAALVRAVVGYFFGPDPEFGALLAARGAP